MVHLPNEPENRQIFRELLFTAPGIEQHLSGVIMYDSSIRNSTSEGMPFADILTVKGITPGIKVDRGTRDHEGFRGELVTQGLDDLPERETEYYDLGARFAKWRAVITIDADELPTDATIKMNAVMLARYAELSQAAGLVPIVEPEVLHAGDHSLDKAELVTTRVLQILFQTLLEYRVDLSALILKTSMVLAGDDAPEQTEPAAVANATLRTLHMSVPHSVGGVVFLSGGQTSEQAISNLNAIAKLGEQPWPITYSFSRAIEEPFLQVWGGKPENVGPAQEKLLEVIRRCSEASMGQLPE
jgi:fructose-bisphosphate aldolase class I